MEFLTVPLTPAERLALKQLAEAECRPEREQLRWLLKQELARRQLWPPAPIKSEVQLCARA